MREAIFCQLEAIAQFAERDNLNAPDYSLLYWATREACDRLGRALDRAQEREGTVSTGGVA